MRTIERPLAASPEEATSSNRQVRSRLGGRYLAVVLTAIIGLLAGLGVAYVALRPEGEISVFSGPPSVKSIDRPAGARGETELSLPTAFAVTNPVREPASARLALDAFLLAEIADIDGETPARSAESFALLDEPTQRRVGSVAAWRQTRAERVIPARYSVASERRTSDATQLTVAASRPPSITPFRGLVAAETTEVWAVVRGDAGWRVQGGRPVSVEPKLPPDAAAVAQAQRWIDRASDCEKSVTEFQLDKVLLGDPGLADVACKTKGDWKAGRLVPVGGLDNITPFVAAFGNSVSSWGRSVEVTTSDQRFLVVLGPVGNEWRVMGLLPMAKGGG